MRAYLFFLGFPLLASGCALAPPVDAAGLPRFSRYTNPAQLDFLLAKYRAIAGETAHQSATATSNQTIERAEKACLGWERTVFDLQSARLYPGFLSLSPETLLLEKVFQDLPAAAQRHPRAARCADDEGNVAGSPSPVSVPAGSLAAAQVSATDSPAANAPASATSQASGGLAPTENAAAGASVTPAVAVEQAPAAPAVAAHVETRWGKERAALKRLRIALALPLVPFVNPPMSRIDPTLPLWPPEQPHKIDLAVLRELAESDISPIRLRARYHLVGLCTLAVEAADRGQMTTSTYPNGIFPGDPAACDLSASPRAGVLRLAQRHLLRSLLAAWRERYPEPMADFVSNLARFVARDNPVLDGPRTAR